MMENKSTENIEVSIVILTFIFLKFKSTPNCPVPKCAAYQLACTMKHNPGVIKQAVIQKKKVIMSWDKDEVGYFVSEDQFIVKTPDCFPIGYGLEGLHLRFHSGDIFWDAETGVIWIENQGSLGSGDTFMENIRF